MENKDIHPWKLVSDWLDSNETDEDTKNSGQAFTSSHRQLVRQKRLKLFLPHLEEEYADFKKDATHHQDFKKIIDSWYFRNLHPLIAIAGCITLLVKLHLFNCMKIVSQYTIIAVINFIAKTINGSPLGSTSQSVLTFLTAIPLLCFVLVGIFYTFILVPFWIISKRIFFTNIEKLEDYFKNTYHLYHKYPYTSAFMVGNKFSNCYYSQPEYSDLSRDIKIPKNIRHLSFDQFINYMKIVFEPGLKDFYCNNYHPKEPYGCTFKCIFFYASQDTLVEYQEERLEAWRSIGYRAPRNKSTYLDQYTTPANREIHHFGKDKSAANTPKKESDLSKAYKSAAAQTIFEMINKH